MFVTISIIVAVTILIIQYFKIEKYKKFVCEHTIALKNIKAINKRYSFKNIPCFDIEHSYDNINFYNDVSPEDYLVYKLVEDHQNIKKAIEDTIENYNLFIRYKREIKETVLLNVYDTNEILKNSKRLLSIEKKMVGEMIIEPQTVFSVNVRLWLIKINGYRRASKNGVFYAENILEIIKRINNKSGEYYIDKNIWQSICRVERAKVTNKLRFAIYQRDNNQCVKCGSKIDLEIDHIFPVSKGGKSNYDNLQTLCHRCNYSKSNKIEYRHKLNSISPKCPVCGGPLLIKQGKYGQFYGCGNYPQCKYIKRYDR